MTRKKPSGPYGIPDMKPYKSMITGEVISGRAQHREHLKRHGCVEIGNEINHAMKQANERPGPDREGIRRSIAEVLNSKGY